MNLSWFSAEVSDVLQIMTTAVVLYVVVTMLIRINGLRSLTSMSSVDFVSTVAIGSVIASALMGSGPTIVPGAVALIALFALQYLFSKARRLLSTSFVENEPLLLMDGARIVEENMAMARVTPDDLREKLRAANVHSFDEVVAVVLERTGDVSVITGDAEGFDRELLRNVRGGAVEIA